MTPRISRYEQAGKLIADQYEAGAHQGDVGRIGVMEESGGTAPETHCDQDRAQSEQLTDLHADVERQQVRQQTLAGDFELLDFCRQAKAVEQAEDEGRDLRIRLH